MSEQDEFEKWYSANCSRIFWITQEAEKCSQAWQACAEQKDREIAALRGFAQNVLENRDKAMNQKWLEVTARCEGLLDGIGEPTPLLTGESRG
jgi:hypothetical protein